jgi:hypothetical protein
LVMSFSDQPPSKFVPGFSATKISNHPYAAMLYKLTLPAPVP